MNSVFEKNEMVLKDPSPLATISGTTDTGDGAGKGLGEKGQFPYMQRKSD